MSVKLKEKLVVPS